MLISLRARGFRNLEDTTWRPAPGVNLLLGPNGAGKTSVLEAVYVAATTRSFRAPDLVDCVRFGDEGLYLAAVAGEDEPAAHRLELGWQRTGGRYRRLDGAEVGPAAYLEALPVVVWDAGTSEVLTGPPALRRRLLDRGLVAARPARVEVLSRYRRALRQKRVLLTEGRGDLGAWNEVLAGAAAELARARAELVDRLRVAWAETRAGVDLDLPDLEIAYRPSPREALEGPEAIAEALSRAADRERDRRMPLVGPHRDDLRLLWGGDREIRRVASAGETKALGLLLAASQARVLEAIGRPPTLLVDDADAELDPDRLARVWPALAAAPQVLATSARPRVWEGLTEGTRWSLAAGRIEGLDGDREFSG